MTTNTRPRAARPAPARALALAGAAAMLLAAAAARAQSDPRYTTVAFVHGFNSDGSTWDRTKRRLAEEFAIDARNPTLEWRAFWSVQAGRLRGNVPADAASVVTIGHSNGGQIARIYNREYYQSGAAINDRMVMVTSLNRGAPLADNTLNGRAPNEAVAMMAQTVAVANYYLQMEAMRHGYLPFSAAHVDAMQVMVNFGYRVELLLARLGVVRMAVALSVAPDLLDMSPSLSAYYREDGPTTALSLNSPQNLTREAGSIWARINIRGQYRDIADPYGRPGGILFATLYDYGTARALNQARFMAYMGALAAYHYYQYDFYDPRPEDAGLRRNAIEWLIMANRFADLDVWWLRMIGALGPYNQQQRAWNFIPSDGIVPITSQDYPGGATRVFNNVHTHTKQTGSDEVYESLREVFPALGIRTRAATVAAIRIEPRNVVLPLGYQQQLSLTVTNLNGAVIPRAAQWSIADPGVATISANGMLSGIAQGSTTVRATVDGITDAIPVQIGPPPPPPPGPSFASVEIIGPMVVPSTCPTGTWHAILSEEGVPGPFQYSWTIGGLPVGSDWPQVTATGPSPSFTVGVRVRQVSTGVERTATLPVSVYEPTKTVPCESGEP